MFQQFLAQWLPACWPHEAIHDQLGDGIRWKGVILFAKLYNFSHGLGVPVSEASADHGSRVEGGHEVIVSPDLGKLVLEVLCDLLIANVAQLSDSGRPDKQRQNVLPTNPALVPLVCEHLPLPSTRDHLLIADVPSHNAFPHVKGACMVDLIHAL